jgi:MCM AAA-lid domain
MALAALFPHLASANPINGEWKDPEKINLDEFPALKPLIDRFDLIYPFRNTRDEEVIREYADKRFDLDDKLIPDYTAYLQKHIEYSKRFNPRLSEEAKIMLKEYYISIAKSYGSPRIRETVVTIAKMIARLNLKDIVDVEDARETMQFYNVILLQLEQVVNITTDPRDEAFEECIEILKKSPFALSFSELIKSACQSNEQVKGYIGDKYELTHNIKLRPILELLLNDSHIIQTNLKPVALQWTETGRERNTGSNSNLYDAYDVYDTQRHTADENNSQDSRLEDNDNVLYSSDNRLQEESSRTLKNNSENLTTPTSYASYTSYSGASGVHSDTSVDINVPTGPNENIIQPIVSVEEFFYDNPDLPYVPLPEHTLKQSPCAPIIGSRMEGGLEWYYCKLHQKSKNINLSSIEQHCKYDSPEIHKSEVIRLYIKRP